MIAYRLVRQAYAMQLDGKGAALYGGRWNSVGRPVIYAAEHRSLAVLEYRVNNPLAMKDLVMISIHLPDDSLATLSTDELPDHWREYSFENPTARLGDNWLEAGTSLVLRVPSAPVPQEYNLLINPMHPRMDEVYIMESMPFLLDQRLYGMG